MPTAVSVYITVHQHAVQSLTTYHLSVCTHNVAKTSGISVSIVLEIGLRCRDSSGKTQRNIVHIPIDVFDVWVKLKYVLLHVCHTQDWAVPGNFQKLGIQWHIPSDEELQLVDRLLEEFLAPEMERLKASFTGESMNR